MRKYRIVFNDAFMPSYPYHVQRKGLIFWKSVGTESSLKDAEQTLALLASQPMIKNGTVLKTYDDCDIVADKLRGKV